MQEFRLTEELCDTLTSILAEGEGVEVTHSFIDSPIRRNYTAAGPITADVDPLMIEFYETDGKYICLDTVNIVNQRQGILTKFISTLAKAAAGTSLEYIQFICVITEAMRDWCLKYGFEVTPGSLPSDDGLCAAYRATPASILRYMR